MNVSNQYRSPITASRDLLRVLQVSFASEITELVQERDSLLAACIAAQDTAAEVQQQNRYFNYMIHATPNTSLSTQNACTIVVILNACTIIVILNACGLQMSCFAKLRTVYTQTAFFFVSYSLLFFVSLLEEALMVQGIA